MSIQTEYLRRSVDNLGQLAAVVADDSRMAQLSEVERVGLRAGVIKNFEITYELSWNMMKRWLVEAGIAPDQIPATRKGLFRLAAENRLIADTERWIDHHNHRNSTSHRYDEAIANFVASAIGRFIDDARDLVGRLEYAAD